VVGMTEVSQQRDWTHIVTLAHLPPAVADVLA